MSPKLLSHVCGGASVPDEEASDTFHVPFLKLIRSLMPLPSMSPAICGSVTMFGLIRSTCETSELPMPPEKPSCWWYPTRWMMLHPAFSVTLPGFTRSG